MENLEVFDMTLTDLEEIQEVLMTDFDDFWTVAQLKNELMAENRQYIVAKENQIIVGFAGVMLQVPEMEILNLVTKKTKRGNGIGTFLLHKMMEIAKNKKIETIFLEVSKSNKSARKIYERAGFCQIGIRKNYYHGIEDAILMSKNVNNLQK